jgi:Protein of unknown function (DUF3489)
MAGTFFKRLPEACATADKGLAFRSKESVCVRTRVATKPPGKSSAQVIAPIPGLVPVRGRIGRALAGTKGKAMTVKLTDAQFLMLSAAAQREDRLLELPVNLKGGAARKVAAKLIAARLVKEMKAKTGAPVWRRDAETGQSFGLKLTVAGLKAAAIEGDAAPDTATKTVTPINAPLVASQPPAASAPRDGTKISRVIDLLQRDSGATLDEVIAETGWLPHTSRAALTGLRKRGYAIEKHAGVEGRRAYFISAALQAAAT